MKKLLLTITCAIMLACLLSACILGESNTDLQIRIPNTAGEEMSVSATDGIFYLPSSVDLTKIKFSYEGEISYSGENKSFYGTLKAGETLDITPAKATDERGAECYRVSLSLNGKTEAYTFYHDSKLGSVFIQTSIGLSSIDASKSNRDKNSEILILDHSGKAEYSDIALQTKSEIKSRGNATFTYLKKAYQIKLSEKTELFGMSKAKTWILLANYTDQSALHNALGFMLGDTVGVPYNIDYRFVNFYVDGEYRGMYMLCEKVQIDGSRVDIEDLEKETEKANPDKDLEDFPIQTVRSGALIANSVLTKYTYCEGMKSPDDITGGYLVELDFRGESEPCHFITESGNIYVVKSPEYASREEMEYIAGLFADMEEAIYSNTGYNRKGVHYSEYLDVESFAGVYTVQELMKNWDAYLGSMFFFKDADKNGETAKIYNGPLWDLDNTLGNIKFDKYFFDDTSFLWAQNGEYQGLPRGFGKNLMEHPEFKNTVAEKYALAYAAAKDALSENGWIAKSVETMGESITMDRTRWKFYDSNSWLLTQYGTKSSVKFIQFAEYGTPSDNTKDTALGFLRYYLSDRADALMKTIGQKVEITPPVQPPEQSSSSSTQQSSSSSTQQSSSTDTSSSVSTQDTTTEQQPIEPVSPDETSLSATVLTITLSMIAVLLIGMCVLVFLKKRR